MRRIYWEGIYQGQSEILELYHKDRPAFIHKVHRMLTSYECSCGHRWDDPLNNDPVLEYEIHIGTMLA